MNDFELLGKHITAVDKAIDGWIERFGLNYSNFFVLYVLAQNENRICNQKFIAEKCNIPKQSVFNACRDLAKKGLLTFCESTYDKRERIIKLTETGKKTAYFILSETEKISKITFNKFGKDKTAKLFELLTEFGKLYEEEVKHHKF